MNRVALTKIVLLISLVTFLFYPHDQVAESDDGRFVNVESQLGKRSKEVRRAIGPPPSEDSCSVMSRIDGNYMPVPGHEWQYRAYSENRDSYTLTLCFISDHVVEERSIAIVSEDGKTYVQSNSIADDRLVQKFLSEESGEPERFLLEDELAI